MSAPYDTIREFGADPDGENVREPATMPAVGPSAATASG